VDADAIVTSRNKYDVELYGPVALENSWQAKAEHGFDLWHFQIDWQNQSVICPTGQLSRSWTHTRVSLWTRGDLRHVCCRSLSGLSEPWTVYVCTIAWVDVSSSGTLSGTAIRTRATAHRSLQRNVCHSCWQSIRTISQAVRISDLRQAHYFGLPKTRLQHVITATAINVRRIVSWLIEPSLRPTQVSRFAALALQRSKPAA
jgi:transposase